MTTKHPGRVAAGKTLAEWNRQKKLNQQTKQKLIDHEETSAPLPIEKINQSIDKPPDHSVFSIDYKSVGVAVIVPAGGYFTYKWYSKHKGVSPQKQTKKLEQLKTETEQPETKSKQPTKKSFPDPFFMA